MMAYPGGWIMARPSRGLDHVERVAASDETRRRLRILLETISGQTSVEEAARRLKLSPSRVHALREQMLQGAAEALEPAPRGRPRAGPAEDPEKAALQRAVDQLEDALLLADTRMELEAFLRYGPRRGEKKRRGDG